MKLSEYIGFESDGSTVIVDNCVNSNILLQEYIFTDKIETITSNVVANIGGNILFQKILAHLYGPGLMMRYNSTQIN